MPNHTFFIGICGPSGSGKSTVAKALEELFPNLVQRIRFDNFYKTPFGRPQAHGYTDFEHPDNFDFENLAAVLRSLLQEGKANIPQYDKRKDTISGHLEMTALPITIVDGFLIYYDINVRSQIDVRTFLNGSEETLYARRKNRQKCLQDEYYWNVVVPSFEQFGNPQEQHSTIRINSNRPLEEVIADYSKLIKHITTTAIKQYVKREDFLQVK